MSPLQVVDRADQSTSRTSDQPAWTMARGSGFSGIVPNSLPKRVNTANPSIPVATLMKALDHGKANAMAPHAHAHGNGGMRRRLIDGILSVTDRLLPAIRWSRSIHRRKPPGPA